MSNLEKIKQELEQAKLAYQITADINQFKTGFLARTAHELRSPLSSLMSLHQLILADLCESPEEEREFINQAYQTAQKLLKMLDEVITVSKIEYGRTPLKQEIFPVDEILTAVYQFTHLQAANKNLKLEINKPNSSLYIKTDFERARQLLISLIDTGINLIEEGKILVLVSHEENSKTAKIAIKIPCSPEVWSETNESLETIPEATIDNLKTFSKKLQLSPAMKLKLAQNLLETMKGQLEIISLPPDNFTQINCLFPLAESDAAVPK